MRHLPNVSSSRATTAAAAPAATPSAATAATATTTSAAVNNDSQLHVAAKVFVIEDMERGETNVGHFLLH
jgi:hypothetical protein